MSPTMPQGERVPARWRGRPALPGRRHSGPAPRRAEHCLRVLVDDLRNEETSVEAMSAIPTDAVVSAESRDPAVPPWLLGAGHCGPRG